MTPSLHPHLVFGGSDPGRVPTADKVPVLDQRSGFSHKKPLSDGTVPPARSPFAPSWVPSPDTGGSPHHRLGLVGIRPPRHLVTADDVGKPSPEPYLAGAAVLGIDPNEAVMIEDSLNGVLAGKAAGATVIGVVGAHPDRFESEVAELADHAVVDVSQLSITDGYVTIDG